MALIKKSINKSEILEKAKKLTPEEQCYLAERYRNGNDTEVDKELALMLFKISSVNGCAIAKYYLGIIYRDGDGVRQDYSKAFKYFKEASDLGDEYAKYCLAEMYYNGIFVKQDYSKAFKYFEEASYKGHVYSKYFLGIMYYLGRGVQRNNVKAIKYLKDAAEMGNDSAMLYLGALYNVGEGLKQDHSQAFKYYKQASNLGNLQAKVCLATMYINGQGVREDYSKAFKNIKEVINCKSVNEIANMFEGKDAFNLAIYLYQTNNEDVDMLIKLMEIAEVNGVPDAATFLAEIFFNGYNNIKKDYLKAESHYKKLIEHKFDIALEHQFRVAYYNLAIMYGNGLGVKQDYMKSKKYHEMAAQLGDLDSLLTLGVYHHNGLGCDVDYSKAKEYWEKAASLGNSYAYINLGFLYYNGNGVGQDFNKERTCFEEAVKLGNPYALQCIGIIYHNGHGVNRDYFKAKEYYENAVKAGDLGARIPLGILYRDGCGVQLDYSKALKCFNETLEIGTQYLKQKNVFNTTEPGYNIQLVQNTCRRASECLAEMSYRGFGVKKNYLSAIEFYINSLNYCNSNTSDQSLTYGSLVQCYLELYYESLANISGNRSKQNILDQQKYKAEAKKYLKLAEDNKHTLNKKDLESYELQIKTYKSILDDENVELSNMDYLEFKNKYFKKHKSIFLLSTKDEHELYEDGIKRYFEKRDTLLEKIERKIQQEREFRYKNYSIIKKKIIDVQGSGAVKAMQTRFEQNKNKIQEETMIDFSDCVVNIDKYLEESIKFIFVDTYKEEKQHEIQKTIQENVKSLQNKLKLDEVFLRNVVSILHNSSVNENFTKEFCLKKIKDFISFKKVQSIKQFPEIKMNNIENYFNENVDSMSEKEKEFIQNIINAGKLKKELFEYEDKKENNEDSEDTFTMGNLFYHTFIEQSITSGDQISTRRVLDKNIVEYVNRINPNMEKEQVELKLNELINKIELFRVVVRNVASHKTELSQKSIEDGLNLCIMQDNSIFALMDDLFGDFILQKYFDKQYVKKV